MSKIGQLPAYDSMHYTVIIIIANRINAYMYHTGQSGLLKFCWHSTIICGINFIYNHTEKYCIVYMIKTPQTWLIW